MAEESYTVWPSRRAERADTDRARIQTDRITGVCSVLPDSVVGVV